MLGSRPLVYVLAVSALVAACGTGETTSTTSSLDAEVIETTSTLPSTTTVAETTTTGADTTTSTTLAGTVIDLGPEAGDELAVVGIAHDDMLNVRAAPGLFNPILDTLEPLSSAVALGTTRDLGNAFWVLLDTDDAIGWSNLFFLAYLGASDDATAAVIDALGEVPTAPTMQDLGLLVARSMASSEPRSRIRMTVAPADDEVVYDVLGLGDDAIYGYRLRIAGDPVEDGFSLRSVERTALCGRGVDGGGLCV